MRDRGRILVRGIVQGVGFRPFVYARARALGIQGTVKNTGSQVEIDAWGEKFEDFLGDVSRGPPLARIDSVEVHPLNGAPPAGFSILASSAGTLSGMIPPDVATCGECVEDLFDERSRYRGYFATSCVNCGPRYSIIESLPYDRERTSMLSFPMCPECGREYTDPTCRRHHAQTIACPVCGPRLTLMDPEGRVMETGDPIGEAASLLDAGSILAIRGIGGFHIACTEPSARELKERLGRTEQPFAIMVREEVLDRMVLATPEDRALLRSDVHPITVLVKRDLTAHTGISNLHTIGCMLPYAPLHHLLFSRLKAPLLIMTSANMPGYPMITEIDTAVAKLRGQVDSYLTHDRRILNRCDDSVMRDGFIIRLSRGIAPKRTRIDLGPPCILGVGPELNSNITIYKGGYAITSPHVGHVRNPPTLAYLEETAERIRGWLGAKYDVIGHDLHPSFLSTGYARALAEETGAELVPVQHHRAHVAATTLEPCIGITIDGVGYGDDGRVWGGEVFAGQVPHLSRVGHLEEVPMPGGDLATRFPERMLYGILPGEQTLDLLRGRGWTDVQAGVLARQVERGVNVAWTSSTGRVLDAVAALLGICRERTYDGEPAMRLEAAAYSGRPSEWPLEFVQEQGAEVLSTRALVRDALDEYLQAERSGGSGSDGKAVADIAASVQYNLARGIAHLAIHAAHDTGLARVALSGGVAYNAAIRETIRTEVEAAGLSLIMNREYPLGDGCISYGQCVWAGMVRREQG
ncbi:MAG TPA: carbamoyltransferase HypF [Methanomicrobiales archaeon]|nr:carbamoyltransferase HypF [Methanomicrobiales archaeon]